MNSNRQLPVPGSLSRWIDRIDLASYRATDHSCPLIHIPEAATTLVWSTIADGPSSLLVVGPRTHAAYYDSKDVPVCARFQLTLGAPYGLLGATVDELTDRVVPLNELWGQPGRRLADQIASLAAQPMTAVKHIESALLARARSVRLQGSATAHLVRQASIELSPKDAQPHRRVSEVARHLGVSERHLRSLFTTTVGISPKQFAQLIRIRTILPGLHRQPWARLASDAGYYDQSHMTAHFREVMHVTPTAFTAGRLPTGPC